MATRSTSITALLNQIRQGEVVLPDLQRDFVWKEEQIRLLLDTILRGYPFGALLLWNTQFLEVPYRDFVQDYTSGQTHTAKLKSVGKSMRMVLDGQQRLQSLYLAIHGTYDGRRVCFNITSGPKATEVAAGGVDDDGTGRNYQFAFWSDSDANRPKRHVRVADIVGWPPKREEEEIDKVIEAIPLQGAEASVARSNLRSLRRAVSQSDLLPVEIVDEDVINADQALALDEVLDIFVRVNSGGTKLTRSDLMFSLIKTRWSGARSAFDGLVRDVNPDGHLPIDKDFVIRGLLMVSDSPIEWRRE
jgi:hypothetical protein